MSIFGWAMVVIAVLVVTVLYGFRVVYCSTPRPTEEEERRLAEEHGIVLETQVAASGEWSKFGKLWLVVVFLVFVLNTLDSLYEGAWILMSDELLSLLRKMPVWSKVSLILLFNFLIGNLILRQLFNYAEEGKFWFLKKYFLDANLLLPICLLGGCFLFILGILGVACLLVQAICLRIKKAMDAFLVFLLVLCLCFEREEECDEWSCAAPREKASWLMRKKNDLAAMLGL